VIARIWKARATGKAAPEYIEYFNAHVVPELRSVAGYEGVKVLLRTAGDEVQVVVITWWTSLEAIRGFAGDAIETAVVHPAAAALLVDFDRHVEHYDVAI
jgi:heme-degrading monooxygenase HmoA